MSIKRMYRTAKLLLKAQSNQQSKKCNILFAKSKWEKKFNEIMLIFNKGTVKLTSAYLVCRTLQW